MKTTPQRSEVSRRLDRGLRAYHVVNVVLMVGWALFFLGIGAMVLTVRFSPQELATRLRDAPWGLDIFLLLPAPEHYRKIGCIVLLSGLLLITAGGVFRRDESRH